uniref:Gfo/Idh/MocA-like oxidoreductase N-terminal domain-containing protein n=2 Tax=Bionectria ochroleuca TaxID=29856 RepID=A0A0B7KQD0_BIOOC
MPSEKHNVPKRLQVGVVGIGRMGRRHAMNILHEVPRATLLCACSPAEPDLVWADEHLVPHGVHVVPTFEEMIETPGLEAIIIASATHLHTSQTTAALEKGLHVLCEKPVCQSLDELVALVDKVEANPRAKLMVGFVRRFDTNYQQAMEQISENKIGRPVVIRSQGCEPLDESDYYKQYLRDSGGIFVDSIIHDIDLSLFFFGEDSRPKSVTAIGVAAVHQEIQAHGDADNGVGICEFWDGKIAFFYNSRTTAHGYDNATEIFGTRGKLSINLIPRQNALELCDKDGFVKTFAHPGWYDRYASAFVGEAKGWVDALLDGKPLPVPLRSSLTSLKIATALQLSLRTGQKIFFDKQGVQLDHQPSVI